MKVDHLGKELSSRTGRVEGTRKIMKDALCDMIAELSEIAPAALKDIHPGFNFKSGKTTVLEFIIFAVSTMSFVRCFRTVSDVNLLHDSVDC